MLVFLLDSIIVHDLLLILVVISLIIISVTMVYLVYFQKNQVKKDNDQNSDTLDLRELSKKLENLPKNTTMNLTDFEKDQEEKAIISYDELLNNKNNVSIGYEKSELKDNIEVKKIDLDNTGELELDPLKRQANTKISLVTYEHEEEFLKKKKKLQYFLDK